MGNEIKRQTDDPLQSKKTDEPTSSQGSSVGPDGVITISPTTVSGNFNDSSYDPPDPSDAWGNGLVSGVVALPEALATGAVGEAIDVEVGAAGLGDVASAVWDWLTEPTPSAEDLPKMDDPADAGTDGNNNGDNGGDGTDGGDSGGDVEGQDSGDGGDDVGAGPDDRIAGLIARGIAAGGPIPGPDDRGDGDGSGWNSRDKAGSLIAGAMALGGVVAPHDDGGDGDGTGRLNDGRIATLIGRALAAGGVLPEHDDSGDGYGTGRPVPTLGGVNSGR